MSSLSLILESGINTLSQVVAGVMTAATPFIVAFAVKRWNEWSKDKQVLNLLQIDEANQHFLEKRVEQAISWVVEQERKNLKLDPNFKIAGHDKLQMVIDFVGPQVATKWIETSGRSLENEIEAILNKNRPDIFGIKMSNINTEAAVPQKGNTSSST
jgi:hypothetical protein